MKRDIAEDLLPPYRSRANLFTAKARSPALIKVLDLELVKWRGLNIITCSWTAPHAKYNTYKLARTGGSGEVKGGQRNGEAMLWLQDALSGISSCFLSIRHMQSSISASTVVPQPLPITSGVQLSEHLGERSVGMSLPTLQRRRLEEEAAGMINPRDQWCGFPSVHLPTFNANDTLNLSLGS